MVRTQIQLTEEQTKILRNMASSRQVSIAELIRQAVDNLIRSSTIVDIEERRKRALEAAGRFSSNLRDLSAEHDRHLEEAFTD